MPFIVVNASGYISGGAAAGAEGNGITLIGLTVFPEESGGDDGTLKINQGISGADKVILPEIDVLKEKSVFHIPVYFSLLSLLRTYVTITHCKVLIEYK